MARMATLEDLLDMVQRLTPFFSRPRQGRRFRPGPVQIVYLTLLFLMQQGLVQPDDLARQEFSPEVIAAFRREALHIAGMLVTEYPRMQKLLRELQGTRLKEASQRLYAWILQTPFSQGPGLPKQAPLAGARRKAQAEWQPRWAQVLQEEWQQTWLQVYLQVQRYLVPSPIVFSKTQEKRALQTLRERLAEDRLRGWGPSAETYLFHEPFDQWLARPLLTGQMVMRVCQALTDQARALGRMIHQELLQAVLEMQQSAASTIDLNTPAGDLYRRLPKARRRNLPMPPNGAVDAEAIFDFAVMSWRQSSPKARAKTVTVDRRRLEPEDFQELVRRAMAVMVHLLWDAAAELRSLPPASSAGEEFLRRSALPESIWSRYQTLLEISRRLPALATTPRLDAWEEALGPYAKRLMTRLDASPLPGQPITARALQVQAYLYDRPFWEWCREALPSRMPDFGVVHEYCLALAKAQGAWPKEERKTFGAPHAAEEAGRMITFYTKLYIEALLSKEALMQVGVRPGRLPFFSPDLPQRADEGLTLWIGQPMPPAALELARVVAPIIAHFISTQARDKRGFLPYRLQDAQDRAWGKLKQFLFARAYGWGYRPHEAEAEVEAVVAQVCEELSRLPLPQSITLALLQGERGSLTAQKLTVDNGKYTCYTVNYKFVGNLQSYILRCLRPPGQASQVFSLDVLLEEGWDEQAQSLFGADVPTVEESMLQREEAPAQVTQAEEQHAAVLERARQGVMHLLLTADLCPAALLPSDARARLKSRQRFVLSRKLMACGNGKQFVQQRARRHPSKQGQGDPLALEVQQLAAVELAEDESLYNSGKLIPRTLDQSRPPEEMVLLAQLLAHPTVCKKPELREAIALLFDLRQSREAPGEPRGYSLACLERVGPRALVPELREVSVRALEVLGTLPGRARKAVVLRLFRLAEVRLLLALLERTGWVPPRWLIADAEFPVSLAVRDANKVLDVFRALGGRYDLPDAPEERGPMRAWLTERLSEPTSTQIFQKGRAKWHGALANSSKSLDQAAAGLVAEWLSIGPWEDIWLHPRTKLQIRVARYLFQTVQAALPVTLRLCFEQACMLAHTADEVPEAQELLGLLGCLSPQLPLVFADPVFSQRLAWRVFELLTARSGPVEASSAHFPATLPREIQDLLGEVRRRFSAFFQAIGQLPDEQERRVVLAALSAAQGRARRFDAWLAGAALEPQTCEAISRIVHLSHHRIELHADQVPALFAQARQNEHLQEAWREVCKG